jgi:mannose-6-phosphate isomerase-like protein (cupin superfamily)
MTRLEGKIEKGWGHEIIWMSNDLYCGKLLVFTRANSKFSMHLHRHKDESWYVQQGKFLLRYIDTETAIINEKELTVGDVWRNPPMMPHQLQALESNSVIVEISTPDSVEDNYRIFPGDSQIEQQY